jgi:hypothetical protein
VLCAGNNEYAFHTLLHLTGAAGDAFLTNHQSEIINQQFSAKSAPSRNQGKSS